MSDIKLFKIHGTIKQPIVLNNSYCITLIVLSLSILEIEIEMMFDKGPLDGPRFAFNFVIIHLTVINATLYN